jgi:hypothetical protein
LAWTVRHIGTDSIPLISFTTKAQPPHRLPAERVTWIQNDLSYALQGLPNNLVLNVHIFITGSAETDKVHDSLDAAEEDPEAFDDDTNSVLDEKVEEKASGDEGQDVAATRSQSKSAARTILSFTMVQVHHGRADLDKLLKGELELAKDNISVNGAHVLRGRIAKADGLFRLVCGSHALANVIRKSVRYPRMMDILRGGPTVSLHVEAFGR